MKIFPQMGEIVGGLRQITLDFKNDEGTKTLRTITVPVEDRGGTKIANRNAFQKAKELIPESEEEIHNLLTAAINEP